MYLLIQGTLASCVISSAVKLWAGKRSIRHVLTISVPSRTELQCLFSAWHVWIVTRCMVLWYYSQRWLDKCISKGSLQSSWLAMKGCMLWFDGTRMFWNSRKGVLQSHVCIVLTCRGDCVWNLALLAVLFSLYHVHSSCWVTHYSLACSHARSSLNATRATPSDEWWDPLYAFWTCTPS